MEKFQACDYPELLKIVENMLNKYKDDFLMMGLLKNYRENFKEKILINLIRSSSKISIEYLSKFLNLKENDIFDICLRLIENGRLNVKIDMISKIIYPNENDDMKEALQKTLKFIGKQYLDNNEKYSKLTRILPAEVDRTDIEFDKVRY